MHRREYILATGAVLGASSIGAVAFSSATVTRNFTVDVVRDDNAIIGLTPSADLDAMTLTDGELDIDPTYGSSDGLNPSADFTYGDSSIPVYAFSVTNNDSASHDFTFSITDNDGSLSIEFFDGGTSVGTVDDAADLTVNNVASGASLDAVITITTPPGPPTNVKSKLTISA